MLIKVTNKTFRDQQQTCHFSPVYSVWDLLSYLQKKLFIRFVFLFRILVIKRFLL